MRVCDRNVIDDENLSGLRSITTVDKKEDDMDLSTVALFWIGVGTVLTGIGVLWFVTVYKEKEE